MTETCNIVTCDREATRTDDGIPLCRRHYIERTRLMAAGKGFGFD
jgi:hypothetical protein